VRFFEVDGSGLLKTPDLDAPPIVTIENSVTNFRKNFASEIHVIFKNVVTVDVAVSRRQVAVVTVDIAAVNHRQVAVVIVVTLMNSTNNDTLSGLEQT